MAGAVLALNCGSSSVKFALYDGDLQRGLHGRVESIGSGLAPRLELGGSPAPLPPDLAGHGAVLAHVLTEIVAPAAAGIASVGHRVVHGGTRFSGPARIDPEIRHEIAALAPLAPAHQPHNIAGIDAVARLWPDMPQVAVFDTAFHRTIPEIRQMMALPRRYFEAGLRRFGFHGISYQSVMRRLPGLIGGRADGRIVICHLGNGCSLAAVVGGRCEYTTMGFTPLDGLMMGRRPGRLDPGAVLWLVEQHGGDAAVSRLLNQEAGLLGVSGLSPDMRILLESRSEGAELALAMFVDRLVQEIGSAAAAIGGLDALVFTGGIGENAATVRQRALEALTWLGLAVDPAANARHHLDITMPDSRISAHVVPCDEELMIAEAALA